MLVRRSHPDLPLVQVRWKHTWGISASWRKRLQLLYFYPPKLFSGLTLMCHRPWQWTTWMCGCVFGELAHLRGGRAARTRSCAQWSFALSISMVRSWQLGLPTVLPGWSGFLLWLRWGKPPGKTPGLKKNWSRNQRNSGQDVDHHANRYVHDGQSGRIGKAIGHTLGTLAEVEILACAICTEMYWAFIKYNEIVKVM